MIDIDAILLVGAAVLIAAIVAARVGPRVGLPTLLLFLGLGLVIGESGLGVQFEDAELARALGFAALVVILAEGGLTTSGATSAPRSRRPRSWPRSGSGVSIGADALFAYFVLGLDIWVAVLLGAVTSRPTPPRSSPCCAGSRSRTGSAGPRGGVRLQRRAHVLIAVLASAAAVGQHPTGGVPGWSALIRLELVGGAAVGLACRLARASRRAPGRPAVVRALSDRRAALVGPRVRRAAVLHLSGFAAVYRPPWCWATRGCRTGSPPGRSPRAPAGWPRSGCS